MTAEITLRLKIGKNVHELTVAEAQDLRAKLDDLLGARFPFQQPISVPIIIDRTTPPAYPVAPIPWCGEPTITYGPATHTTCLAN